MAYSVGLQLVRRRGGQGAPGGEDDNHLIAVRKGKEIGESGFQYFQIDRVGMI